MRHVITRCALSCTRQDGWAHHPPFLIMSQSKYNQWLYFDWDMIRKCLHVPTFVHHPTHTHKTLNPKPWTLNTVCMSAPRTCCMDRTPTAEKAIQLMVRIKDRLSSSIVATTTTFIPFPGSSASGAVGGRRSSLNAHSLKEAVNLYYTHTYINIHTYMYNIGIYICVCII
jgi:hypothetical protein